MHLAVLDSVVPRSAVQPYAASTKICGSYYCDLMMSPGVSTPGYEQHSTWDACTLVLKYHSPATWHHYVIAEMNRTGSLWLRKHEVPVIPSLCF
jgi:hypothetical protein